MVKEKTDEVQTKEEISEVEVDKEKLAELRKIIEGGEDIDSKEGKLIFDGQQYSLKIPKKYIESLNMNIKQDVFNIQLITFPPKLKQPKTLRIELVRK